MDLFCPLPSSLPPTASRSPGSDHFPGAARPLTTPILRAIVTMLCVGLALVATLVPTSRAGVYDFSGPVTTVGATPGPNQVTLDALDPGAGRLVSASIGSLTPSDLTVADGAVAWSAGNAVYFYMYDPYRTNWVGGNIPSGGSTFDLRNTNGMVAWTVGNTLRYAAYDWMRGNWRNGQSSIGTSATLLELADGTIAGATASGVFYAAYDARAGVWRTGGLASGTPGSFINAGGIVAWTAGNLVYGYAYDAISGTWKGSQVNAGGTPFDLKNANGVLAWTRNPVVGFSAFDSPRGSWANQSVNAGFTSDLSVSNATVAFSTTLGAYRFGYQALPGTWAAGSVSTPRAYFLASTNSGNSPLTVVFADLSLGGRVWNWNFGDSSASATSSRRAPHHRFNTFGSFTVAETVSGDGGVSVTNTVVTTDTIAPGGTVTINNGDATTTNINVTLQLAANDNSGSVASMRFSNGDTNWSAWQAFAAAAPWTLTPGSGTKTVWAQFRDAAFNVSTNATDTIDLDVTPPPLLTLVSTNVSEGSPNVILTAVLDHAINRTVTVNYTFTDGTAFNGADYTGQPGVLSFAPNVTTATLTIPLLGDQAVELDETFFINLSTPTNAVVAGPATVTILDDDAATVSFTAPAFNVGEDAGTAAVSVRLNAASGQTVSVRLLALAGTATAGQDFVPTNALLVFLPGQTNRTINLPILDDTLDELTETVSLSLTNFTNAVIGLPAQSLVNILDNDQPFIGFSADAYSGFEDEFSIAVQVRLSKPYSQQVSASYTITGGSATPGIDYTILGTIILPANTTNATLTIFPINDSSREADETIRLRLTDIAGAAPARVETVVTLLDEDGAPRFLSPRTQDGQFQVTIRGRANQTFNLFSSTNLLDWTLISPGTTGADGTLLYTAPATGPKLFYRTSATP